MRLILVITVLAWSAGTVIASDAAEREILGFSPDGRYFAFEQFGIEDGSGFPYSEIFIMDTETDSWLPGTPVRIRLSNENSSLHAARDEVRKEARDELAQSHIGEAGVLYASYSTYQIVPDPRQIAFRTYYTSGGHTENVEGDETGMTTVALEEIVLPSPKDCPVGDTPFAGFVLKLRNADGSEKEAHRDTQIPSSRGCPVHYSLSDVVGFSGQASDNRMIVLVSVYAFGFEGLDRRFIALRLQ